MTSIHFNTAASHMKMFCGARPESVRTAILDEVTCKKCKDILDRDLRLRPILSYELWILEARAQMTEYGTGTIERAVTCFEKGLKVALRKEIEDLNEALVKAKARLGEIDDG